MVQDLDEKIVPFVKKYVTKFKSESVPMYQEHTKNQCVNSLWGGEHQDTNGRMVYIFHTDDFACGNVAGGASGHRALERAAETNYANGNRVDISGYPTIRETKIPSAVEYVTQLESVNGEHVGFSHVLMESGGRLAIRAQVGTGKTTALELTISEMMQSGEVEFVLFFGCRITQISDLQQQFNGLGKVETYHKLMNDKRYWRPGDDSPIQVTTTDSLHRYAAFPFDRAIAIGDEARSNIGAICDSSKK